MATSVLESRVLVPDGASDAQLLETLASLLAAMPDMFVRPRLSELVVSVCSAYRTDRAGDLGEHLVLTFAAYLQERHAVSSAQVTVAGVDVWASHARIDVVRCALLACARRLRAGGAR